LGIIVDMNDSAKLGNNLKRIREAKKMSQGDVMRKMGCSRSYVSNIENGKTNPTLETISKLAKVLDVSTTELLK
jgi:transcriptional regulator with XRE-family HTH domain